MHGIFVAAIITTIISIILWGGILYWLSKGSKYFKFVLITVPFSAIVNLFIKKPVYELALYYFNISPKLNVSTPLFFLIFVLFLSPITEEAIKLLPLIVGRFRRFLSPYSALWIGFALGVGFGLGEIWYLAWNFSMVPEFAGYPFYYFTGFMSERMIVVFIHGVMTSVAVVNLLKGWKGGLFGYIYAVLLHALTNFGAFLYQIQFLDLTIASLYILIPVIVNALVFERLRKKILISQEVSETVYFSR
ncbi:MAG: PrsW family glutamic-type intramembrane protease [Nitrososphaeria archaeon]